MEEIHKVKLFKIKILLIFCLIFYFIQMQVISLRGNKISERESGLSNEQLTIKEIRLWPTLEEISKSAAAEIDPIGFWLEVSWPMDWDKGECEFLVNGQLTPAKEGGGGFGQGYYNQDFFIYAGQPGPKTIEVLFTSEKRKAKSIARADFSSSGGFVLLNSADRELIDSPQPLKFLSWLFKNCRVLINGNEQKLESREIFNGLQLLSCQPEFHPGLNQIYFSGLDFLGQLKEGSLIVFYAEGGKIKVGDRFSIKYDCFETKSSSIGLVAKGEAICFLDKPNRDNLVFNFENNFLDYKSICLQPVEARAAGQAIIKVVEFWWPGGEKILKEIKYEVQKK
ncbi:MAG TPA: hypothetical protein ENO29_08495 [Candidatus Aminicenantes bacterium]|nr:MAG: hypothetical protein C0168_11545 [Candidatus Aminicenantes bacterium]HEK86370.1 hypothetical protein [Candidatus Aminicenantes bacterium]